ncbi:MAG: phosphoribosylanthranilate isomerase [Peptococcaceae bacterium]|nr:phosphoribosylanthranilate isomerase [Peptococcaceae bacterium]MDH7525604.1 phosphoribosylanthranilate isomerase [Peptococcaceae bacterium]
MVWVKICGITNPGDAVAAAAAGANAVGFVFAPGPRKVDPEKAREIAGMLPPGVEKIGVFVNEAPGLVEEIARCCRLTGLQFHGGESPEYCLGFPGYQVIKAFSVRAKLDGAAIGEYILKGAADRVLLDAYVPGKSGGTGMTFPWEAALDYDWKGTPLIVAGGLTPGNVGRAVRMGCFFGVDVSSGVEKEPGIKDAGKIVQFIKAARRAAGE